MSDVVIHDNSKEAIKDMHKAIEAALEAIGQQAVSHTKRNITERGAVDTGNLRNSVDRSVKPDEEAVYVGTNVEYAVYVEFGTGIYATNGGRKTPWRYKDAKGKWHTTSGMKPRHFLKDAIEQHITEYMKIAKQTLQNY